MKINPEIHDTESPRKLAVGVKELAALIGLSERTLWTLTNQNAIPHTKIGKRTLYPLGAVEEWLQKRTAGGVK